MRRYGYNPDAQQPREFQVGAKVQYVAFSYHERILGVLISRGQYGDWRVEWHWESKPNETWFSDNFESHMELIN